MAETWIVGGATSGILGNGQADQRHQADDDDHQREHRGEDRPIDEETSKHEASLSLVWRWSYCGADLVSIGWPLESSGWTG